MSRVFYPKYSRRIPASKPHPEGTEYYVAVGEEDWDGEFHTVTKVQMMYNGKIAGRKSPSYPINSGDSIQVAAAITVLEEQYKESNINPIETIPALKATYVPASEFIALIMRIPEGYVTRWEDLIAYLKRMHGAERIELHEVYHHWQKCENGVKIPYWRVVGTYGYLSDDDRYGTRENQEAALSQEGLQIEPCGHKDQYGMHKSKRVKDIRKFCYDLSHIPEQDIRNTTVRKLSVPEAVWDMQNLVGKQE